MHCRCRSIPPNLALTWCVVWGGAGTGKEVGDRHPKVSDNVLIGASATILGNITIGKGAQVAAGSLVLKDVPPRTMVAGSPAKEVGKVTGGSPPSRRTARAPSQEPRVFSLCVLWNSLPGVASLHAKVVSGKRDLAVMTQHV